MDDDGTGVGPWKVCCTMFKEKNKDGDDMLVYDFDGTDPQSDSSINWFLSPNTWKMYVRPNTSVVYPYPNLLSLTCRLFS